MPPSLETKSKIRPSSSARIASQLNSLDQRIERENSLDESAESEALESERMSSSSHGSEVIDSIIPAHSLQ